MMEKKKNNHNNQTMKVVLLKLWVVLTMMAGLVFTACTTRDEPVPPTPVDPTVSTESVLKFFKEINAVPRPSNQEKQMRAYLSAFASARQLECINSDGNIIIYKGATAGMEQAPSLVLQTHMDMVCVAAPGLDIDFEKTGIEQEIVDGCIQSRGNRTSLGADDGIGMAIVLAILDSKEVKHGPLECLFTWNEEAGMSGAEALKPDVLKSKLMINLDSEEDGKLLIGTAGCATLSISKTFAAETAPSAYVGYSLSVGHLAGGHSGVVIAKGGASAIKLMVDFLATETSGYRLAGFNGGTMSNAIAVSAEATVLLPSAEAEAFESRFNQFMAEAKKKYAKTDPDMTYSCAKADGLTTCLPADAARLLLGGLIKSPQGVLEWNKVDPSTFELSSNIGIVKIEDGKWNVVIMPRAFSVPGLDKLINTIETAFEKGSSDVDIQLSGRVSPWAPNINSPLIRYAQKTYQDLYGKVITTFIVGGGVEASKFSETYPGMQIICLGPTIYDCHSIKERVVISTIESTFRYTLELLSHLQGL